MDRARSPVLLLLLSFAFLTGWSLVPSDSHAQDPITGELVYTGDSWAPLYVVPDDSTLVLTSLVWLTGTTMLSSNVPQIAFRSGSRRFYYVGLDYDGSSTTVSLVPFHGVWDEGITFEAGTPIEMRASGSGMAGWRAQWSGYLLPADEQQRSLPPILEPPPVGIRRIGPNPMRASSRILYQVPAGGEVGLRVYDAEGRIVRRLAENRPSAGSGTLLWDGHNELGHPAVGGTYFFELTLDGRLLDRGKTVLIR